MVRKTFLLGMLFVYMLLLCSCSDSPLDPDKPVTLTMWHVYGAQARSPMNILIDRFNQTVGKEQGIIINVTSVSSTWNIHDELVASAREEPGSEELPDLFTCYPKTLAAIGSSRVLDWKKYFSEEELQNYVPAFLEEGMVDGALCGFPFAKSTNLLYVNDTLFEPFSRETGVSYADLRLWKEYSVHPLVIMNGLAVNPSLCMMTGYTMLCSTRSRWESLFSRKRISAGIIRLC